MSFKNFTLDDLRNKFGIENEIKSLFKDIKEQKPSDWLKMVLEINSKMPTKTEKAKSEYIIAPILTSLVEMNNSIFTVYSGETLTGDKDKGLYGECDFILAKNVNTFDMSDPIFSIVEAKKEDIQKGIYQCSAQMLGIKLFNQKHNKELKTIYGCVTIVDVWKFLKLEGNTIFIDKDTYYLKELNKILGIFQNIIDECKKDL